MLADTAIAVNPADERYSRLIGETAILPLVGRRLPIIADEHVDPEFGTGALKITPGHDSGDFEIGRRHGLEEITVIGEDGRITDSSPERFQGMEVDEARSAVVAALREESLISGTQPYEHDVPHSHRSGRRIEPLISLQWFCDMNDSPGPAIEVVEDGRVTLPSREALDRRLSELAREHPSLVHLAPALVGAPAPRLVPRTSETYVGETPPEGEGWERDPDVLDTWFSSGLWPFATLGWPRETPQLRAFYPTDVLSTARDIIFLWVARMVMFGVELTGEIPFADVNIHSVIQAPDGRRMSKSLGTGIDPSELIEGGPRPPVFEQGGEFPAYGADALRFGLLAMSSSQDVRFNEERVKQGRDLANKLWNASRLILLRVSEVEPDPRAGRRAEDRWIVSQLERHTQRATEMLDGFRFSAAALELYGAFWSELCDWYLELAKPRLYEEDNAEVSAVLLWALERTLRLLHPVMPFVTEEIWGLMPGRARPAGGGGLARGRPVALRRACRGAELGRLIEAVTALRRYRDEVGAKPGKPVRGRLAAEGYDALTRPAGPAGPLRVGGRVPERRRAGQRADSRRRGAGAALRGLRRRRGVAPHREEARSTAHGDRARRAQAGQRGVRGQGSARGGGRGAPQARRVP